MAVIKTQFTMRLDVETHCKIQKIAGCETRSLTNMIDYLIKQEIRRYEAEHGEIVLTTEELYPK